ncbi:MAG TPA: helix-turn-helix domain-containing protein [Myxococcota bacterium]|nr:helix-turn-helix domain-containing protein [Myxococcota bacterium]
MAEARKTSAAEGPKAQKASAPEGRKAATQARILDAAVALFSVRGYERTSVNAIAARAGVSHSAVFWHFGDKATLFQEAFRTLLVPFVRQLQESVHPLDSREHLLELFVAFDEFVGKNRETIETIVRWVMESRALRETLRKPLFDLHDAFLSDLRGSLEKVLGNPRRARALAASLVALLDGSLLLWLLDSDEAKQELRREGLRALVDLVLREAPPA